VASPRVKFTGRKPNFRSELGLAYGDYCEVYVPNVVSKNVDAPRTEPCIALYPSGNANGSWVFLNIKSKRRVRRTNWTKMVTTDLIIDVMNEFSKTEEDATAVGEKDDEVHELPESREHDDTQAHTEDPVDLLTASDEHNEAVTDEQRVTEPPTEGEADAMERPDTVTDIEEADDDDPQEDMSRKRQSARVVAGVRRPMRYRSFHTTVKKGLQEHGAEAYKAIVAELRQLLLVKKALVPVSRCDLSARQLKNTIRSLMFMKTKFDGLGRFEKIKARLVANGKQQDRTLYPDTFSPTVALQSVLMCLTLAAKEQRKICAIDIGGAYLNAERVCEAGEEIVMELEPRLVGILSKIAPEVQPYVDDRGVMLVKLSKAMYGTLDAAKIWYDKLTGVLKSMGFTPNEVDPCVMNKNIGGKQCTIMLYVDDLLVTCQDRSAIDEVTKQLQDAFEGDVKYSHDEDLSYLGMHLKVKPGCITVSMEAYLDGVLKDLGVNGYAASPATANLFKVNKDSSRLGAKEAKKFHTTVAKLLYLAKRTRVDALLAVAFLSTRVKAPTSQDAHKLERLLKYLSATRHHSLVIKPRENQGLEGFIDASFGCHGDGKSHTGLVITLFGCMVMCMSSKQKLVTRDSTEAELVALSDKLMHVIQCYDFMRAQGVMCDVPVVHQDNTSTITLVTKGGGQYRTKYMRVRQGFVKERHDAGEIQVKYLETGRMLADNLTKPLQGAVFQYLTRCITRWNEVPRHRSA
jgi:hypothetical protein